MASSFSGVLPLLTPLDHHFAIAVSRKSNLV
jgi:hypothetical protein